MKSQTRPFILSPLRAGLALCAGASLACAGFAEPTPFQGDASFKATLSAGHPTAATDAPRIEARLQALGVGAKALVLEPTQIELTVTGARDMERLQPVFSTNRLSIGFDNQTIDNTAIASASVVEPGSGWPQTSVEIKLTDEGAETFCAVTKTHIGNPVRIAIDDEVVIEPVIREAICGGGLVVEMGSSPSANTEAMALAASLGIALESTWVIETVQAD